MKTREEEEERTKTRVSRLPCIDFDSSLTIWQEETQSLTTAKSANTSQNGVSIEKNGRLRNRGLELLSQRKWYPETDHNFQLELSNMDGELQSTTSHIMVRTE